jgi:hypothetical protein
MSKIASSCENCIFARKVEPLEDPGEMPEYVTYTGFFGGTRRRKADNLDRLAWQFKRYHYLDSINGRTCTRFPATVWKDKDDLCGEHQAVDRTFEPMTEEELIAGLENLK